MEDDKTWDFNAPQHYFDLPTVSQEYDSEQADQYFFSKEDDTVYYEPSEQDETLTIPWNDHEKSGSKEEFPVQRRRSRSVGSRPLFLQKAQGIAAEKNRNANPPKKTMKVEPLIHPDQHFMEGLRSYTQAKTLPRRGITKPMPFNLTMTKKKSKEEGSCALSLAECVKQWECKTPERFHRTRHGEVKHMEFQRVELHTTAAHTPNLAAVHRHRPVHVLSREEREKQELEEMKKSQFKAHPVDEKIFKAPSLPPKKELKVTKVEPFHLTELQKKELYQIQEPEFHFHAKPIPKTVMEPVHVERKPIAVTIPQTPKFSEAGKASLQQWRRRRSKSSCSLGSGHSTSTGSLTSSTGDRPKNTVVEPFSFEDRDRQLQKRKEQKIKKSIFAQYQVLDEERKQREFHANPCPDFHSPPTLPERSTVATKPVPFHLSCETRGISKMEKFRKQMEEMRLQELKAAQFKAKPAPVLTQEPCKSKSDTSRHLTEICEFSLSLEKRAAERKKFEEFLKMRQNEIEAAKKEYEERRLQEEEKENARLRQETVFVANPIRQFKTKEIQRAQIPVTVPQTPNFLKK